MIGEATLKNVKVKGYFIVRDKNGKPRIDGDPRKMPDGLKAGLTEQEYALAIKEYDDGIA